MEQPAGQGVVFTQTLDTIPGWNNTVLAQGNLADEIDALKSRKTAASWPMAAPTLFPR